MNPYEISQNPERIAYPNSDENSASSVSIKIFNINDDDIVIRLYRNKNNSRERSKSSFGHIRQSAGGSNETERQKPTMLRNFYRNTFGPTLDETVLVGMESFRLSRQNPSLVEGEQNYSSTIPNELSWDCSTLLPTNRNLKQSACTSTTNSLLDKETNLSSLVTNKCQYYPPSNQTKLTTSPSVDSIKPHKIPNELVDHSTNVSSNENLTSGKSPCPQKCFQEDKPVMSKGRSPSKSRKKSSAKQESSLSSRFFSKISQSKIFSRKPGCECSPASDILDKNVRKLAYSPSSSNVRQASGSQNRYPDESAATRPCIFRGTNTFTERATSAQSFQGNSRCPPETDENYNENVRRSSKQQRSTCVGTTEEPSESNCPPGFDANRTKLRSNSILPCSSEPKSFEIEGCINIDLSEEEISNILMCPLEADEIEPRRHRRSSSSNRHSNPCKSCFKDPLNEDLTPEEQETMYRNSRRSSSLKRSSLRRTSRDEDSRNMPEAEEIESRRSRRSSPHRRSFQMEDLPKRNSAEPEEIEPRRSRRSSPHRTSFQKEDLPNKNSAEPEEIEPRRSRRSSPHRNSFQIEDLPKKLSPDPEEIEPRRSRRSSPLRNSFQKEDTTKKSFHEPGEIEPRRCRRSCNPPHSFQKGDLTTEMPEPEEIESRRNRRSSNPRSSFQKEDSSKEMPEVEEIEPDKRRKGVCPCISFEEDDSIIEDVLPEEEIEPRRSRRNPPCSSCLKPIKKEIMGCPGDAQEEIEPRRSRRNPPCSSCHKPIKEEITECRCPPEKSQKHRHHSKGAKESRSNRGHETREQQSPPCREKSGASDNRCEESESKAYLCEKGRNKMAQETRYAITRVTKYDDYTTYEVLKSTRAKPRKIPEVLEKIFIEKEQ